MSTDIQELPLSTKTIDSHTIYDFRLRSPLLCRQNWSHPQPWEQWNHADHRIPEAWRAERWHYETNATYLPLSLKNAALLSMCVPATKETIKAWKSLLVHVQELVGSKSTKATATIAGPAWAMEKKTLLLDEVTKTGPAIPHYIWLSVISCSTSGVYRAWAFMIPNITRPAGSIEDMAITLCLLQHKLGIKLWDDVQDEQFIARKNKITSRWW